MCDCKNIGCKECTTWHRLYSPRTTSNVTTWIIHKIGPPRGWDRGPQGTIDKQVPGREKIQSLMKEWSQFPGHTMFSEWNHLASMWKWHLCVHFDSFYTQESLLCIIFRCYAIIYWKWEVAGRHNLHFYKLNDYEKKTTHIQEIQKEHDNTKKLRNFEMKSETGRGSGVYCMWIYERGAQMDIWWTEVFMVAYC